MRWDFSKKGLKAMPKEHSKLKEKETFKR